MKTRYAYLLLLLAFIISTVAIQAQDMTVRSFSQTIDQTANLSENLHKDNNGEYGGLVKVNIAAPNADFEGWVLEQKKYKASEYWVFMAKGSRRIKVYVEGYLPMEVEFSDYGIDGIKSCHTYLLTIVLPQVVPQNKPAVSVDVSTMTAEQINKQESAIADVLGRINIVSERYPELKASEIYQSTMASMNEYEEKVRKSRMVYNDSVTKMNRMVRQFPSSLVAALLHFGLREYLEVEDKKKDYPQI